MAGSRSERTRFPAAVALLSMLGLAACGGSAGGGGDGDDARITFVEGLDVFPYEVVTVAIEKGFFEEEGLQAEIIHTENEIQALASNNADFAIGGSLAVLQAADSGIDVITMFASMEGLGMNTAFSNELVEESGLSPDSPLEERISSLEGETIGLTGPLGDDEVMFRYFLSSVGLDPDEDVSFAYIGGTPDRISAMDAGEISAYMSSIPAAELAEDRGVGKRMITPNFEEIDELAGIPYSGVHVMRSYAEDNEEQVMAVGRALAKASTFMVDNPDETIEIIEAEYPELSPEVVRAGMESIFPAIPESGRMTQEGWNKLRDVGAAAGVIDEGRDVSEGGTWTNEYLP